MTIPTYLPYFVLVSASAIIATILFGLRNALGQTPIGHRLCAHAHARAREKSLKNFR